MHEGHCRNLDIAERQLPVHMKPQNSAYKGEDRCLLAEVRPRSMNSNFRRGVAPKSQGAKGNSERAGKFGYQPQFYPRRHLLAPSARI